jgi:hypothetical protein
MTIKEIGAWENTWAEELYKRDYENLPDFMIDCLWEYFDDGGSANEFNETYQFGSNHMDLKTTKQLIEEEYEDFIKEGNTRI